MRIEMKPKRQAVVTSRGKLGIISCGREMFVNTVQCSMKLSLYGLYGSVGLSRFGSALIACINKRQLPNSENFVNVECICTTSDGEVCAKGGDVCQYWQRIRWW